MNNTIVHDQPTTAQAVVWEVDGEGLALAATWGHEDALAGIDRRGSWYYRIGGLYHGAYNEGYDNGIIAKWEADGCPVQPFTWSRNFSDVVAAVMKSTIYNCYARYAIWRNVTRCTIWFCI